MNKSVSIVVGVILAVLVALGTWAYLNQPEDRSLGEKLQDAGNSLDEGLDDAGRQLQDRSPLEKMEDGINDATDGDAN